MAPPPSQSQIQVKLVVLGDAAVGKSSLVLRFVKNEFQANKEPTIGAAFVTQKIRIPEAPQKLIKFEIWDTAGQERFNALAPMYYRGAHAAIVVYDVTQKVSFERAKFWIQELRSQASPDIVVTLAGNKSDLLQSNAAPSISEVPRSEASRYARDNGLLFYETSAKSGSNVIEMFTDIARHLSGTEGGEEVKSPGSRNTRPPYNSSGNQSRSIRLTASESSGNVSTTKKACAC